MDVEELAPAAARPAFPVPAVRPGDPATDESQPTPIGGLPLGSVLGVTISLLLALLLGGLTALQLHREERREREVRGGLLSESLAPLASEIERVSSVGEIMKLLSSSARAEVNRGHPDFNIVLSDGTGRVIGSVLSGAKSSPPHNAIEARVPVRSAVLASGRGTLTAWQDGGGLAAEMKSRRREAWLDIGVAVLAVIFVVQLAIYVLLTRPLSHLMTIIDKVEQGYPLKLRQVDIARELRWLEWRFHRMNTSLTTSARLLVAAHRRAMEASKSRTKLGIDPMVFDPFSLDRGEEMTGHEVMRQYLRGRCALLERYRPGDPRAEAIALEVWEHDAGEAERFGEMNLRARLESAALMILDPEAFNFVSRKLKALVAARENWCAAIATNIESELAANGVTKVAIQHRTKRAAGVWRKMQERDLSLEEMSDLLAFRIIVSSQEECYLALDTVHRLFEPEPFRFKDYIAAPKANGYQSLHTSVRDSDGFVFEVQIRTVDMHRAAENGSAAHWRYRASTLHRR
jgi:HAMP domain-containing protein